jgi:ubiquitin-protein ligase E3 A
MEYEGDDMEDTFMQTFRICYQDIFGNTFNKDLKENGDQIFVNKNNRQVRNINSK